VIQQVPGRRAQVGPVTGIDIETVSTELAIEGDNIDFSGARYGHREGWGRFAQHR
jgi:hypothetical protein